MCQVDSLGNLPIGGWPGSPFALSGKKRWIEVVTGSKNCAVETGTPGKKTKTFANAILPP